MPRESDKAKKERLEKELHDDFVKMDKEAAKHPNDVPYPEPDEEKEKQKEKQKEKEELETALIQETNQDGLIRGHNAI